MSRRSARRDPRITAYIGARAPFARPILKSLRRAILQASPEIEEAVKWGMPAFTYHGKIVCGIAGFKAHCALWFWRGKAVVGARPGGGMGQFGRIASARDVPSPAKVKGYVRKAMALIDEGRTRTRRA